MSASAASTATRLAALGDPVRLRLLTLINDEPTGEVCACDLHPAVARSQPTVSHHLRVLTEAGLLGRIQRLGVTLILVLCAAAFVTAVAYRLVSARLPRAA